MSSVTNWTYGGHSMNNCEGLLHQNVSFNCFLRIRIIIIRAIRFINKSSDLRIAYLTPILPFSCFYTVFYHHRLLKELENDPNNNNKNNNEEISIADCKRIVLSLLSVKRAAGMHIHSIHSGLSLSHSSKY